MTNRNNSRITANSQLIDEIESLKVLLAIEKKKTHFLDMLISLIPGHIYWLNTKNEFLGCNNMQAKTAQLKSRHDIVGKTNYDMPWKKQASDLEKLNNLVMRTGKPQIREETIETAKGKKTYLSHKEPLRNDNEEIIGLLGVSIDISYIKKLESELRRAKELAESGERAKTAFIANMSHDLRTPLAGIVGEANILQNEINNEELKRHAVHLAKSGGKLLAMYNEIIEDITSGKLTEQNIEEETFDIIALAEELQDLEMPTIITKGLKFGAIIDPDIPQFLVSDRKKIERIIENLLGNAIKFTKKGRIDLKIEFLEKHNNTVKIKFNIIDTGIGVPEESKAKLFERFYKASPSYKGEYQGFGLGLDIAKNYTHVLGGTIGFESTEGVGSDFYVILTIRVANSEEITAYSNKLTNKSAKLKLSKDSLPAFNASEGVLPEKNPNVLLNNKSSIPRILVIEDNLIARSILMQIIKKADLNPIPAEDGESALELAKIQPFDLILTDIGLPGISGIEFAKALRDFEKKRNIISTPIIAVTAHSADGQNECLGAGIDAAIQKPITPESLSEILHTFLPNYKIKQ